MMSILDYSQLQKSSPGNIPWIHFLTILANNKPHSSVFLIMGHFVDQYGNNNVKVSRYTGSDIKSALATYIFSDTIEIVLQFLFLSI